MGWEQRGERAYYYGKERLGGRIRSIYLGGGTAGRLAERFAGEARERREAERKMLVQAQADAAVATAASAEIEAAAEAALAATLIAAGYRQHARGEWRKRRGT